MERGANTEEDRKQGSQCTDESDKSEGEMLVNLHLEALFEQIASKMMMIS